MKKLSFLFIMVVASILATNGQDWVFAEQFGSTGAITQADVKVDGNGDIYIVGNYINAVTIGGLPALSYSDLNGKEDMYLCKFDANGNALWARQIASTNKDLIGGLAIDPSNNVYVVGAFQGDTLRFQGEALEFMNTEPAGAKYDAFIAKYDGSGALLTADSVFWGTNVQRLLDVTYDYTKDLVVLVGQFQSELRYDSSGVQTLTAISQKDHIVARFTPTLDFVDKAVYNGSQKQSVFKNVNNCVIADTVSGYFVTGDIKGDLLDAASIVLISAADATNMDIMVNRFTDQLGYLWGRKGGGTGFDHINSSGSDAFGNIYFTGKTDSPSMIVDSTAILSAAARTTLGGQDYTVGKYNRNGNLLWLNREGGPGTDNAYGLSVRGNRFLYAGQIDNGGNVSSGFSVYDLEGNVIITDSITGDGTETGLNVTFDLSGDSTIVIGVFDGDSMKAGDFRLDNTASGVDDGFLVKYGFQFSVFEVDKTNILCNGASTGSIEVGSTFGTVPVTYAWTPNVSSTTTATNLPAGTYKIVATDFDSRKDSVEIILTEPPSILITEDGITQTSCNVLATSGTKNDGGISLTVSGGSPAFTYAWSGGSGFVQGQEDQTTLTAGTYYLEVTDANSCVKLDTFLVTEPTKVSHFGSVVDTIKIPPGANGAIHLNTFGGDDASYTFSWTGPPGFIPSVEDTLENLEYAGNYNLQVTDASSCVFDTAFNVPADTGLALIIEKYTNVSCKDDEDGYAKVKVTSGGTGSYSYAWRKSSGTPVGINSDELTDVPSGTYIVKVTDLGNASTAETSIVIDEPATFLTIGVDSVIDESCNGETDGAIYITVNGGWGGYSYLWSPTNKTTPDILNVAPGLYTVQVADTGLNTGTCVKQYTDIAVTEPELLTVNIVEFEGGIACNGEFGRLLAQARGGSAPYFFQWDDPGAQNDSIANDLSAGIYSVDVQDANGCPATDNDFSLTEPTEFVLVSAGAAYDTASGETTIAIEVSGGTASYTYKVSGSGSDSIVDASTTKNFNYSNGGNFTIMVIDANNCGPLNWDTTGVYNGELIPGVNVSLYPNPSNGQFTLELDNRKHEDIMLEIISITGQQVYKKLHKYDGQDRFIQTIDLGRQAGGTYFLRVNGLPVNAKLMLQ